LSKRRALVFARWELRRHFESGGMREALSSVVAGLWIGGIGAFANAPQLAYTVLLMAPFLGATLPILSFTKEREGGLLPALLASPACPGDIVLGKTAAYTAVCVSSYWFMIGGTMLGLDTGYSIRELPVPPTWQPAVLLKLGGAMSFLIPAAVAVTVCACWLARRQRDAFFWAFVSYAIIAGVAFGMFYASAHVGRWLFYAGTAFVGAASIALLAPYSARLSPEAALIRWKSTEFEKKWRKVLERM